MIGAIGAIVGLAGQMAGLGFSSAANKRAERQQRQMTAEQVAAMQLERDADPMQRSENRAALGELERQTNKQVRNARGVAKITGATPEYGLAVQQSALDAKSNLISGMSANESQRRDRLNTGIRNAYKQQREAEIAATNARQQSAANIMANSARVASSMIGSYGGVDMGAADPTDATTTAASPLSELADDKARATQTLANTSARNRAIGM